MFQETPRTPNYAAWDIFADQFPERGTLEEQAVFLLQYAILAPSTHNAQGWRFSVKDGQVSFFYDAARHVPVADARGRLRAFGLGGAIECFYQAALFFGYAPVYTYAGGSGEQPICTMTLGARTEKPRLNDHPIHFIRMRRTNRWPFLSTPLPESYRTYLQKECQSGVQTFLVESVARRYCLAEAMTRARVALFSSNEFRKELSLYKRTNLTRSGTGIPGFTMRFSLFKSLAAPFVIRRVNMVKKMQQGDVALLQQETPAFVVCCTTDDNERSWIDVGRMNVRHMLTAARAGLATAMMTIPQEEPLRSLVRRAIDINAALHPQLLFRVGYSTILPPHSPRLPLADVLSVVNS
jgi:nitroreductase